MAIFNIKKSSPDKPDNKKQIRQVEKELKKIKTLMKGARDQLKRETAALALAYRDWKDEPKFGLGSEDRVPKVEKTLADTKERITKTGNLIKGYKDEIKRLETKLQVLEKNAGPKYSHVDAMGAKAPPVKSKAPKTDPNYTKAVSFGELPPPHQSSTKKMNKT